MYIVERVMVTSEGVKVQHIGVNETRDGADNLADYTAFQYSLSGDGWWGNDPNDVDRRIPNGGNGDDSIIIRKE